MHSKSKSFNKIIRKISKAIENKLNVIVLIFMVFCSMNFPQHSMAQSASAISQELVISSGSALGVEEYTLLNTGSLPELKEKELIPVKTTYVYSTAYNSLPNQTDGSPCTTANGFNVCEHGIEDTVATNALPFGTKVQFPEMFGDRIFVVRDRMNARYSDRVDFWMISYDDARHFGKRYLKMVVLE